MKEMTLHNDELRGSDTIDAQETAQQAKVELAILLEIVQLLRLALQWMKRGRGNTHKLSTLRFHTSSLERQVMRMQVLADFGGYLHLITEANPHLVSDVAALRSERAELHCTLERIVFRLELVAHDDVREFAQICSALECFLDSLRTHGQKENELRQHSFTQEDGGSG